jgi:hypothetical protein
MTTKTDPLDQLIEDTAALEPGDVKAGDYIRRPGAATEDMPDLAGMVVADMSSAGWSMLYDTVTRESSVVNNNMKAAQLKATRSDGSLVFTAVKPSQGPRRGSIKCFLHEDQPDRAKYAEMGFAACPKASLPNQYQADNHARNRHRDEWRAVEAEREALERVEDRKVAQAMLQAVGATATAPPSVALETTTDSINYDVAVTSPPTLVTMRCKQCGAGVMAEGSGKALAALRAHHRNEHPKSK